MCCISKLGKLAAIVEVLPVTTATVERTFSNIKLIKTRLRSRLSEETLDYCMRICIEGPDHLTNENLEVYWNIIKVKVRKINL